MKIDESINSMNENSADKTKLKNATQKGLTRGAIIAATVSLSLMIILGVIGYKLYSDEHNKQIAIMTEEKMTHTLELINRDSLINDWILTFDQIENDLSTLKRKQNIL